MMTREKWEGRLTKLRELVFGWETPGEYGDPIAEAAFAKCAEVVDQFGYSTFTPVPMDDGGLLLEWGLPKGRFELEIRPDGTLGFLYAPDHHTNYQEWVEGEGCSFEMVADYMERLR